MSAMVPTGLFARWRHDLRAGACYERRATCLHRTVKCNLV